VPTFIVDLAAPPQDLSKYRTRELVLVVLQQNALILERLTAMSTTADQTAASVTSLDAKVDTLIALVTPSIQTLRDQLAAAQAQIASLQAGDAADAATLTGTIAAADAEAAKVQAAIDALTPPPAPAT
jgi:hypothetical protein